MPVKSPEPHPAIRLSLLVAASLVGTFFARACRSSIASSPSPVPPIAESPNRPPVAETPDRPSIPESSEPVKANETAIAPVQPPRLSEAAPIMTSSLNSAQFGLVTSFVGRKICQMQKLGMTENEFRQTAEIGRAHV